MLPADGILDHDEIEVDVQDSQGYDGEFNQEQFNQLMQRNRRGDDRGNQRQGSNKKAAKH
jgi:hypothetical protein